MSRPALVALAHGSRDRRSARTVRDIVAATRKVRPDLCIEVAFLDHSAPDLPSVVTELSEAGHPEIVVVPLFLTSAYHSRVDAPAAVAEAAGRLPHVRVLLADPIGTEPSLLTAIDDRLSSALRFTRTRQPDALVLASAGSSDARANLAISTLAQQWGERHRLPASVAFASTTAPSAAEAVDRWFRLGCRRVAVGSLFIAPGTLLDRVQHQAVQAGAVAVSQPLGAHAELSRVLVDRYIASASPVGVLV